MYGKVTDVTTGLPVRGICVTLGPPGGACWSITDSAGNYAINGTAMGVQPSATQWELYFLSCSVGVASFDGRTCTSPTPGYPVQPSDRFTLTTVQRKDWAIHR